MPAKRIKQLFTGLPFERKLIGAGALLLALSVFLPWYQDLDSFKTGDIFLGITGPLYLLGLSLLGLAVADIAIIVSGEFGKKLPMFAVKPSSFFLGSGIAAFYLLLAINSVYFHNKFGVNITIKESQFGMFLAFIASSLVTIGGYLSGREKKVLMREFQEHAQDSFIKIPDPVDIRKPKENLRNISQQNAAATSAQTQIDGERVLRMEPERASAQAVAEDKKFYQPYRSDL
jgi:hypothetical protein